MPGPSTATTAYRPLAEAGAEPRHARFHAIAKVFGALSLFAVAVLLLLSPFVKEPIGAILCTERPEKLVLDWTTFFGRRNFFDGLRAECPYRCSFSYDRRLAARADLLVFHARDFNAFDLPDRRNQVPKVFFSMESPVHTYPAKGKFPKDFFNYTMTYRSDSDVRVSYDRRGLMFQRWVTESELDVLLSRKSQLALIAHSNCGATPSQRGLIVEAMNNVTRVTQVGRCAHVVCNDTCLNTHIVTHFFYLAFENSVCEDYVTEKFFRMARFIVPVVLSRAVVPKRIPAHSFVAVDDFPSIPELVDYLQEVAANRTAYRSFFKWALSSDFYDSFKPTDDHNCRLCELAHQRPAKRIHDVEAVFGRAQCRPDFARRFLPQA